PEVDGKGILTDSEEGRLNDKIIQARLEIDNELVDGVNQRVESERNVEFQTETDYLIAEDVRRVEKELSIVEAYERPVLSENGKGDLAHKKKGYSSLAIDPRSLPEDLREVYFPDGVENETLKKRKVFVE